MTRQQQLAADLHKRLDWLQFERSFHEARFLIVDQECHGFGGQLSRRMLGLQLGYIFERTVVFVRPNDPPYEICYQPTGRYTFDEVRALDAEVLDFTPTQRARAVYLDFPAFWANERLRSWFYPWIPPVFAELNEGSNPELFPARYVLPSAARLFFDGQVLTRFQLRDEYRTHIEETKSRIGFRGPIIGVHIRRGDKNTEAPYVPMRVLVRALERVRDMTGITRVFVTSDSNDTFNELPADLGFEYVYDRGEPRYNNANHLFLQQNPDLAIQETRTSTKILELLASCDWIVGPDNTHFICLAIALNGARTLNLDHFRLINGRYLESYSNAELSDWPLVFLWKHKNLLGRCRRALKRMPELIP